jgi:molybdenum cofactor cytidylyltransferase
VVAIVLAAGSARRMGTAKQRLPLGRTTLLGWVLAEVAGSAIDRAVVVCDAATAGWLEPPAGAAFAIAVPPESGDGSSCLNSIRAGLEAAGDREAAILVLGDMPGVGSATLDALAGRWRRDKPWAIATAYTDGPGHPLVFAREAFGELRALHGDRAVWRLIERRADRVAHVDSGFARPLDVDTWDDYQRVAAALAP